jgi:hypothetical protein
VNYGTYYSDMKSTDWDVEYLRNLKEQVPMPLTIKDRFEIISSEIDEEHKRADRYFLAILMFTALWIVGYIFHLLPLVLGSVLVCFFLIGLQDRAIRRNHRRLGFMDGALFTIAEVNKDFQSFREKIGDVPEELREQIDTLAKERGVK